jgi:hypothetical protein
MGTLSPIVFFENSVGEIALPPTTEEARRIYETSYRARGWEWREAGTLAEVDALQRRMVEAERRQLERELERDDRVVETAQARVRSRLYARMASSTTSEYEKEFIRLYLQLREEKRATYRQRWMERVFYLWSREQDSGTKVTDRIME